MALAVVVDVIVVDAGEDVAKAGEVIVPLIPLDMGISISKLKLANMLKKNSGINLKFSR